MARALAIEGIAHPAAQILVDRDEARFLGSVELDDGQWFAVSKLLLTMIIAQGRDAQLMGLPTAVIDVLRLTCPELITVSSSV